MYNIDTNFIGVIYENKRKGDMAKSVDATDLIGLSLGMETYQVITFKFRETLEF